MTNIRFKADLIQVGSRMVIRVPKPESRKLPSRGMVMADGTLNEVPFVAPLEPDGQGSHWIGLDDALLEAAEINVGDTVSLAIAPAGDWPDPEMPEDLKAALEAAPQALVAWMDITPMARWDWIRWMRATNSAKTRQGRIDKMMSMLTGGKRRPCCFNRSLCTDVSVSHRGILMEPGQRDA